MLKFHYNQKYIVYLRENIGEWQSTCQIYQVPPKFYAVLVIISDDSKQRLVLTVL